MLVVAGVADRLWADAVATTAEPAPAVDFIRDIKPIFVKHCYECHGPGEERGGLSLSQHALAFAGGDSGEHLAGFSCRQEPR
jgi:mono/diheme cytochrome c family protein